LASGEPLESKRVRRSGAGRTPLSGPDPSLLPDLLSLVEPTERGDPMSGLRWTTSSTRRLAEELVSMGHSVCHETVRTLLIGKNFSLQGNRKTREGSNHPDRDAQFQHIAKSVGGAMRAKQPVVSADTKKKELVGDFKNNGRTWRPKGNLEEVRMHDFLIEGLGRALPYGVYDLAANAGWRTTTRGCRSGSGSVNTTHFLRVSPNWRDRMIRSRSYYKPR
jgi:hypothetical protein